MATHERVVRTRQSGEGPYGQIVVAGVHVLSSDEPETAGGRNTGPDPYELLLSALGACTAMTIRMYAERHAYRLEAVEVELRHARRAGADGRVTDRFEREILLTGQLSAEERARLVEIAGRCPVSQTLSRGSEVTAVERQAPWGAGKGAPASDAGTPAT